MERPHYFLIGQLLEFCTKRNYDIFMRILGDHHKIIGEAPGSTKNHQAWDGGYIDHITEVLNIAVWLYTTSPRKLPFGIADALEVLFLHDLEKPFKHATRNVNPEACLHCGHTRTNHWTDGYGYTCVNCTAEQNPKARHEFKSARPDLYTKEARKKFRNDLIKQYGIELSDAQENALEYVEGMRDKDYKSDERVMEPLAAFCHTCDLWSARVWHDKGRERSW